MLRSRLMIDKAKPQLRCFRKQGFLVPLVLSRKPFPLMGMPLLVANLIGKTSPIIYQYIYLHKYTEADQFVAENSVLFRILKV